MTFIEAAAEVLRKAGKPLHYKEITELAIAGTGSPRRSRRTRRRCPS
jgi:hypothetical protein